MYHKKHLNPIQHLQLFNISNTKVKKYRVEFWSMFGHQDKQNHITTIYLQKEFPNMPPKRAKKHARLHSSVHFMVF